MSEPSNFLKGQANGAEVLVPQLLLDGNYISYSPAPASPDTDGVEGLLKTAPDGLYYFSEGLWRKVPAYTGNWNDLTDHTRFLQVDKYITLSVVERKRLQDALGLSQATSATLGLVMGSNTSSTTSGTVAVNSDGTMSVPAATLDRAGTVRVTDLETTGAPIVATKSYVDNRVSSLGTAVPRATTTVIGGFKVGGDIVNVTDDNAYVVIQRSEQQASDTTYTATAYGLVRIAPSAFTDSPLVETYDDARVTATGRQPYVVTVSQARNLVNESLARYTIPDRNAYIATESTPGFVKPGPSMYIDADGTIGVVAAAVRTGSSLPVRGTVLVDNGDETAAGSDLSKYVPTVSAVRTWVQDKGYLTSIPVATSTSLGGVKVNGGGLLLTDGTLSVQFPTATTTKLGCVMLDGPGVSTSVTKVPSSAAVNTFVRASIAAAATPDATATTAGKVKVLKGSGDATQAPYTAVTASWAKSDFLASPEFASAVGSLQTGWSGGTVDNPAIFNSTVQLNGMATLAGEVQDTYAATAVLNYRQVAALIAGGSGGGGGTAGTRVITRDLLAYTELLVPLVKGTAGWSAMYYSTMSNGQTANLAANIARYPLMVQAGSRLAYYSDGTNAANLPAMDGSNVLWAQASASGYTFHAAIPATDILEEDVTVIDSLAVSIHVTYPDGKLSDLYLGVAAWNGSACRSILAMSGETRLHEGGNVFDIPVDTITEDDTLIIFVTTADSGSGLADTARVTGVVYSAHVQSTGTGEVQVPWASYQKPAAGDVYGIVSIPNDVQVSGELDCYEVSSRGDVDVYGAVTAGAYIETPAYVGATIVQGAGGSLAAPGPNLEVKASSSLALSSSAISLTGSTTFNSAVTCAATLQVAGVTTLTNSTVIGTGLDPLISGTSLLVKGKVGARSLEVGTNGNTTSLNENGTITMAMLATVDTRPHVLSAKDEVLYWEGSAVSIEPAVRNWFVIRSGLKSYLPPSDFRSFLIGYDGAKFNNCTVTEVSDSMYYVSTNVDVTATDFLGAFQGDMGLYLQCGLIPCRAY